MTNSIGMANLSTLDLTEAVLSDSDWAGSNLTFDPNSLAGLKLRPLGRNVFKNG